MSHVNATLTPITRLLLARLIVEQGWTCAAAAKMFMVASKTAKKWADRYRAEGRAGMADRSSRPHHSPAKTSPQRVRQIVRLRWRLRLGPVQIAGRLGVSASTVHAVLVRCRINRLSRIDPVTGERIRQVCRYEHDRPGSMIHVDVTKFGNIPDGGGHRFVGRQQGYHNQLATPGLPKGKDYKPRTGKAFLHTVIDDHSRVAYAETHAEIHADEKAGTAAGVLERAVAWFKDHGVTVERVLSDNGSCYRSFAWRDTCAALGITHKRTRPYRPQTNGKIERFHRTLADEWAYARFYDSTDQRNTALPGWLHFYNHHRAHSAIGGRPPVSRLTNVPDITARSRARHCERSRSTVKLTGQADTAVVSAWPVGCSDEPLSAGQPQARSGSWQTPGWLRQPRATFHHRRRPAPEVIKARLPKMVAAIRSGRFDPVAWGENGEPETVLMSTHQYRDLRATTTHPQVSSNDPTVRHSDTEPLPTSRAMTIDEIAAMMGPDTQRVLEEIRREDGAQE